MTSALEPSVLTGEVLVVGLLGVAESSDFY
jgi:hypothetical protein